MPRKRRDIHQALAAKGFEVEENDHTWYTFLTADGKRSLARTKLSHGSRNQDISDVLIAQMARQVRLTGPQFRDLIDCPLERPAYEEILRRQETLPRQEDS